MVYRCVCVLLLPRLEGNVLISRCEKKKKKKLHDIPLGLSDLTVVT